MPSIEQLYKEFGVLQEAKEEASKHEDSYKTILKAAAGSPNEKRLASQFAARFFKHFPGLAEETINALLDICEDNDVMTRRQAIKDLPAICKVQPELVPRLADILSQLLRTDDSGELVSLQQSLQQLFSIDAKGTLDGVFHQIQEGDDVVKNQAVKFLVTKQKSMSSEVWTKEVEDYLLEKSKKVLDELNAEQFVQLLTLLNKCTHLQTLQGRKQLLDILIQQADLDQSFDASDSDALNRLIVCTRLALQLCSRNVHSLPLVRYLCIEVLPVLTTDCAAVKSAEDDAELQLYRILAELANNVGPIPEPDMILLPLFTKLLTFMPLAPETEAENGDAANGAEPDFNFSAVECLLHTLHELGKKHTAFLTEESDEARMKDFRKRLQYFARGNQTYLRTLKMDLAGKKPEELKSDENKVKLAGLKTTGNISVLIKDLFHNPPSYKNTINLSWKPQNEAAGIKRAGSLDGQDETNKSSRQDQQRYAPPGGKFSNKAGVPPSNAGRGRYNRGRGFRGGRRNFRSGYKGQRYSY